METKIMVNGRELKLDSAWDMLSYEQVARLANIPAQYTPTVLYSRGANGVSGILIPGQSVGIQNGMRFDVAITGNA